MAKPFTIFIFYWTLVKSNIKEIKIEPFPKDKKTELELASGQKYKLNIEPISLLKIHLTDKTSGTEIGQPIGIVNGNYYIAGWIPSNEKK